MNPRYRQILKDSGIYGLGQMLSSLASIVMLPLYTRKLTPADYGVTAILDLTATLLTLMIASGLGAALLRYHQDAGTHEEEATMWWTGLSVVGALTIGLVGPALLFRDWLSAATLGAAEVDGGFFFLLTLGSVACNVLSQTVILYFRIRTWAWLTVLLALASLFVNIGLNVYFLVQLQWGITGVLAGNLITQALFALIRLGIALPRWGRFRFDRRLALNLGRFGAPVVAALLLATAMHQANRYLLVQFVDLESGGVYALAAQIAQGVNTLVLVPFSGVWVVSMYDIARQPNAREVFAKVFEYFVYGVLLVMLGVSLFAKPILALFATPAYAAAAPLVPIICFSLVFYGLDIHLRVPALLAKRTLSLVPPNAIGAALNIGLNLWLIPIYGIVAAAWVGVATYAVFAAVTLLQNRRIDRYDYPLGRCALVMGAMVATVVAADAVGERIAHPAWALTMPALLWLGWAVGLMYPVVKQYARPHMAQARS
jgi:O-antigen/teichoic acid export membrane protein